MVYNCRKILPCIAFTGIMSLTVSGSCASLSADRGAPTAAVYSQLEAFHGHACAGSIFGARLGLAAREALKAAGGTGKFTARYYDLSCPVDGIQVTAGTTYGNGALAVEDRDEHRLVLTAAGNKRQVEARLTARAEQLGLNSRELARRAKSFPAADPQRAQLEQEISEIYEWLRTAPEEDVVAVARLKNPKAVR